MRYEKSYDFAEIHSNLKNTTVKFPTDMKLRRLLFIKRPCFSRSLELYCTQDNYKQIVTVI
jgi:hypothetical protein